MNGPGGKSRGNRAADGGRDRRPPRADLRRRCWCATCSTPPTRVRSTSTGRWWPKGSPLRSPSSAPPRRTGCPCSRWGLRHHGHRPQGQPPGGGRRRRPRADELRVQDGRRGGASRAEVSKAVSAKTERTEFDREHPRGAGRPLHRDPGRPAERQLSAIDRIRSRLGLLETEPPRVRRGHPQAQAAQAHADPDRPRRRAPRSRRHRAAGRHATATPRPGLARRERHPSRQTGSPRAGR